MEDDNSVDRYNKVKSSALQGSQLRDSLSKPAAVLDRVVNIEGRPGMDTRNPKPISHQISASGRLRVS